MTEALSGDESEEEEPERRPVKEPPAQRSGLASRGAPRVGASASLRGKEAASSGRAARSPASAKKGKRCL